jgi:hypothetical protein
VPCWQFSWDVDSVEESSIWGGKLRRLSRTKPRAGSNAVGFRRPTSSDEGSAICSRLDAIQLRVMTFPGHQFIVCADFHQPRAVQHEDEVGHAHG